MAKDKKSFIFYSDWIDTFKELPKDKGYDLLMHILSYVNDENPETEDFVISAIFAQMKNTLKRDLIKWESQRVQRVEAGKKSAEVRRAKKNDRSTTVNEKKRKSTVSVSDNVSVSVNDKDKYKKRPLSEIKISDLPINKNNGLYLEITKAFQELFIKNIKDAGGSIKKIQNAKGVWIDHIRLMYEIDGFTQDQFRAVWRYLQEDQFWKKNILSTSKLRLQFNKLLLNIKNNGQKRTNKTVSDEKLAKILYKHLGDKR